MNITTEMIIFFIARLFIALCAKMSLYGLDILYLCKHTLFVGFNQYVFYSMVQRNCKDLWYWTITTFVALEIMKDIFVICLMMIAKLGNFLAGHGFTVGGLEMVQESLHS